MKEGIRKRKRKKKYLEFETIIKKSEEEKD